MNRASIISSLVILILSQSAFAHNFRVIFCNNASSANFARIIIYDAENMYGGLMAEPGHCDAKNMDIPNLIEVRVFYGLTNAPKYIRLSNAIDELKVDHKNYYLPNGKLAETTDLLAI